MAIGAPFCFAGLVAALDAAGGPGEDDFRHDAQIPRASAGDGCRARRDRSGGRLAPTRHSLGVRNLSQRP